MMAGFLVSCELTQYKIHKSKAQAASSALCDSDASGGDSVVKLFGLVMLLVYIHMYIQTYIWYKVD